jgi:hypothetical protein
LQPVEVTAESAGERGVVGLKRVFLLGVVLAVLGAGCGAGATLGAKGLSEQAMSLQSAAAEGALLAHDVASGRTTRIYAREHSADLSEAASKVETSLKNAKTDPGLEGKLRRLVALAARARGGLERLGSASEDDARTLERRLRADAGESREIAQGLE